jgi:hypothetical protein
MSVLNSLLWRSRDTLERHDAHDGSEVRFEFPLGFQIKVSAKGITFAGTSVNYDVGSIELVELAIEWAKIIAHAMRDRQGIPPQAECEGNLIMRIKGKEAWWKGQYNERMKETDGIPAAAILRSIARKQELKEIEQYGD